MAAVTRKDVVFGHLHDTDGRLRRTGRHGYLRLARTLGVIVDDLDGKRSGRHIGYRYPLKPMPRPSHSAGLACTSTVTGRLSAPRKEHTASLSRMYCVSVSPGVVHPVSSMAAHAKGKAART